MAHTLQHSIEILPQDDDRLFVLLSLGGKLQLDLGRKVACHPRHRRASGQSARSRSASGDIQVAIADQSG